MQKKKNKKVKGSMDIHNFIYKELFYQIFS